MLISILVAMGRNRAIGFQNALPWRLSADLKRFKELTMGHHILMGRKTYESIGRVLPGRTSIVITRQMDFQAEGCLIVHSLDEAIALAKARGEQEAFIIGGAEIYAQSLPHADRLYLTLVDAAPEADVFFPAFVEADWQAQDTITVEADDKNQYASTFTVLHRKPTAEARL